ncbi:MAG: hypothetical protein GWO20_01880, partial [Candidatus Korarchaeota archaeon]|nr:hypothetical protein [Candidatus Korarchaeota archaeon]NIU82268.1 hypothetical protein [Candidatus Thorarchaeota archaeon]NIW12722.1 hypothetical protein [Candidatus Thorarchaeota archaeon]NIW50933.1 hypothetical protein [Candidatus Korarchaeota archaeon]
MEGEYAAHKEILNFLVDIFNHISNPGNLKTIILETNRELSEINWFGLSTLFKELFKDLSEKQSDPTLYGATVRLIAPFYQKTAMNIAEEVENLIEELSEWNYDRAVGLALAAEGLLPFNEERSLTLLNKALNYAHEIPDRSDKSIAFCEILPILYKADMKTIIPDVFDEIVYEPKKIEASMIIAEREPEKSELIKNVLTSLPNEKKNLFYAARANHTGNKEVREELCAKALENVGTGIDATKTKEKVFEVYHQHGNHNKASELVQDLSHELFKNVSKRPYVSILIDLISFLLSRGDSQKGFNMLRKLKNRTGGLGSANRLFIFNKIANILSINGFFEEGVKAYHETLNILGELDELSLSSSLISIGVSILTALNY